MKLAVIETGGKQYLVKPGDKVYIEKIPQSVGDKIEFDKVLLFSDGGKTEIGNPNLKDKKIPAEVLEQKRLPKVTVFRYHSKTRYRKKKGHRQYASVVKISDF